MTTKSTNSVLFLGKKDDEYCNRALKFVEDNFENVTSYFSAWGEPMPEEIKNWRGEYILSYLCRWVVPLSVIQAAQLEAINFHPASPDYPGIGCNNYALYDNAAEYGATCHHMAKTVDTGKIIAVKRFAVLPTDDVSSLLQRTYEFQLVLFYEIVGKILTGEALPVANETWTRHPRSRKEFNQLGIITPDMSDEEIARRVRAVSYGIFQPAVELGGYRFELKVGTRMPVRASLPKNDRGFVSYAPSMPVASRPLKSNSALPSK
jgi:methionyl-tRNA formyltransferase